MTINETVLAKLAEAGAAREGRQALVVPDKGTGWSAALTTEKRDELSCAVWEMSLQRTAPAPADETLQKWADRAAQRVSGLLESLRVYEVDPQRNEALLRSHHPTRRGDDSFYYEVHLRGTTQATVRRFQGTKEKGKRLQVAFALTHEQVAKLAGDLTGK
jgi:hypothetical protein